MAAVKISAPPDGVLFQERLRTDPFWMLRTRSASIRAAKKSNNQQKKNP